MWRQSFDIPMSHYEEASGGFSDFKKFLQLRNNKDRIRTISTDIQLDNTCDIGGSKGYFVEELLRAGYKGVYGIDPNKIQVQEAQRLGIPMIIGSTKDIHRLFPEKGTNNASLLHVIEHLPDPIQVMTEIYEALPIGGHLIVETPDFSSFAFKKRNYVHKLVYQEHLFYFSSENLQRFLENRGFIMQKIYKRDFDQYHLNVRESLFRLGFIGKDGPLNLLQRMFLKMVSVITVSLALLVKLCGRNSFVLLVARKPDPTRIVQRR